MFLRAFIAGYVACVLTIAAVGLLAKAFSQVYAVSTIGSYHFDRDKPYNEKNYGLGLESVVEGDFRGHAGYYKNSFYRDTAYLMASYTPWRVLDAKVGPVGGFATGYLKSQPAFMFGLAVVIENKDVGLNLIVNPAAVALQLKLGLNTW